MTQPTKVRINPEPPHAPDSPRERALREQVNALLAQVDRLKERLRAPTSRKGAAAIAEAYTRASQAEAASGRHRRRMEEAERELSAALRERAVLTARVDAGAERRREMIHVLNALLTCEDDTTLTDGQHDRRMDEVVKRARTLGAAERAAVMRGEGTS